MKEILSSRAKLIDEAQQKVIDQVASTRRSTRERAICALTTKLDPNNEHDQAIFQTLPLEFLERGDLIGAIWYIETIGKLGNAISMEVIERVLEKAMIDRVECIQGGDEESLRVVDQSIGSLFRMAKSHPDLSSNPRLLVLQGGFEEEKGDIDKALRYYDEGIMIGDTESHLASARIYENIGHISMSRGILDVGYYLTGDLKLLGNLIRTICRQGNYIYARALYIELQTLSTEPLPPFLVYRGTIESERDLEELESIIASYITDGLYVPSEALTLLSKKASIYIEEKVQLINSRIAYLNSKSINDWSEDEKLEYWKILFDRLWLLQIDTLTLGEERYLHRYLGDIHRIAFGDLKFIREELSEYFSDHSSDNIDQPMNQGDRESKPSSLYEDISEQVARIGDFFSHPSQYQIQQSDIIPMIRASAKEEGEYNEEVEEYLQDTLVSIRDGYHYFSSLKESVRSNYEDFIKDIDEKYGVFYRRNIQNLAIDADLSPDNYPVALRTYPDVALLFWIEKMLANQFPTDDLEEIEDIVQTYGLDQSDILHSLLFGALIYDVSVEYAIEFLADYPNMLDVPEAIYIITEGLRQMDSKERKQAIKDLHKLAKDDYDARGFFEHIRFIFGDIEKNGDPSEEDMSEMFLVNGNIAILQKKEQGLSLLDFHTAGSQYGSLDGLLQAGDSYENMGEYDRALQCFEQAFVQDSSIQVVTKILYLAIHSARFDLAYRYIQYGLSQRYSIRSYILAYHLWQGNIDSAILQTIMMILDAEVPMDTPPGTNKLLFDILKDVLDKPNFNDGKGDILKVQASFILANLGTNDNLPSVTYFMSHWQYVTGLPDSYEDGTLHQVIFDALSPITGNIEDDKDSEDAIVSSPSNTSIRYISNHGQNLINTCEKRMKGETDEKQIELGKKVINDIAGLAIMTLKKFPNSEKAVAIFISELEFSENDKYKPTKRIFREPIHYIH